MKLNCFFCSCWITVWWVTGTSFGLSSGLTDRTYNIDLFGLMFSIDFLSSMTLLFSVLLGDCYSFGLKIMVVLDALRSYSFFLAISSWINVYSALQTKKIQFMIFLPRISDDLLGS